MRANALLEKRLNSMKIHLDMIQFYKRFKK